MPQRYVALRMADARALRGDYPRVRYASSDAPLPPLSSGARAFLPHAQSFAGSVRSHRPPVRSSSDATGLYMVVALDEDEGEDGAVDVGGRGGEEEASLTDELSTEDALSLLGEEATARKRSTGHTPAGGDGSGGWVVAKESMFLVSAFLVLFTSGGLILGFGPVYSTLVKEGQWSELCSIDGLPIPGADGVLCAAQEIRLQYVFSTSFLCLSAANAFFGVLLDVVGPRVTVVLGLSLSALGNAALAIGDSKAGTGSLIIAGYAMVGAGGMGSYLASFQILQLYRVQGFVCSTLSSLFNCSGYVYMLLQLEHGVTRQGFFGVYGLLVVACASLSFLLFPTVNVVAAADHLAVPGIRLEKLHIHAPVGLLDGLKRELAHRPDLWFFAIFFGWISLLFAFAGGALPSLLTRLAGGNESAAATFTDVLYPVLVNGTFLYSPAIGYTIDRFGFKIIFVACLMLAQAFALLLLVPSLAAQLLTFIVYALAQACLYALQFAYIMMCFPPELYGTLQAFLAIVSFSFGLINYVINPWAQTSLGGDYTAPIALLGLPSLGLYACIHVIHNWHDDHDSSGDYEHSSQPKEVPANERTHLIPV